MKIDLAIWTLNGEKTLSQCLNSISQAIPENIICHRFAVDGGSRDKTVEILEEHSWQVIPAFKRGIPYQANQALSWIHTPIFASFEQDIVIMSDWYSRVSALMADRTVTVAQGIRFFKGSKTLEAIDSYRKAKKKTLNWFYSLDNTMYRTEMIRRLGGFPTECPVFTDGLLRERLISQGYRWIADHKCVSSHLRSSYRTELQSQIRRVALLGVYFNKAYRKNNLKMLLQSIPAGLLIYKHTHVARTVPAMFIQRYAKLVSMLVAELSPRRKIYGRY